MTLDWKPVAVASSDLFATVQIGDVEHRFSLLYDSANDGTWIGRCDGVEIVRGMLCETAPFCEWYADHLGEECDE